MNSTKAKKLVDSGNIAYYCPVSNKLVKTGDTMRVDIEVPVKNDEGEITHYTMKTLRVASEIHKKVAEVLKTEE